MAYLGPMPDIELAPDEKRFWAQEELVKRAKEHIQSLPTEDLLKIVNSKQEELTEA